MHSLAQKNGAQTTPAPRQSAAIQPKLMVNAPGDRYEQEADAMAERVVRMSDPNTFHKPKATGLIAPAIQRKCSACEEEEKKKKNGTIMRKAENNGGFAASPGLVSQLSATKGQGRPLPKETRSFMENAFSADFSGVRVHTDGWAATMSDSIRARAFTYGSDVYFNQGQYNPDAAQGKSLLAHELTHVVQQSNQQLELHTGTGVDGKIQRVAQDTAATDRYYMSTALKINLLLAFKARDLEESISIIRQLKDEDKDAVLGSDTYKDAATKERGGGGDFGDEPVYQLMLTFTENGYQNLFRCLDWMFYEFDLDDKKWGYITTIVDRHSHAEKDSVLSNSDRLVYISRKRTGGRDIGDESMYRLMLAFTNNGYRNLYGCVAWMLYEFDPDKSERWKWMRDILDRHPSKAERATILNDDSGEGSMKKRFQVQYGDRDIYELMRDYMAGINLRKSVEWMFWEADPALHELKPERIREILLLRTSKEERREIGQDAIMKALFFAHLKIQGLAKVVPALELPLEDQIEWLFKKDEIDSSSTNYSLYIHYVSGMIAEIATLLEHADYSVIENAKQRYREKHNKELTAAIIASQGGKDSPSVDLIRAVFFLHSEYKSLHTLDFAIALMAGSPDENDRANEIYQILEQTLKSLEERKKLQDHYEEIFFYNKLTEYTLVEKLKRRFTHDADKKMLALFHHELTKADELVYQITGDTDYQKTIAIFTDLIAEKGFEGIRQLERDWNEYIMKPLIIEPHNDKVGYSFHKKPLFDAVKETYGRSDVWKIIEPIQDGYINWKIGQIAFSVKENIDALSGKQTANVDPAKNEVSRNFEDDLLIETAIGVIENATYDLDPRYGFRELKDTNDPIMWAASILGSKMPARINNATGQEKQDLQDQWEDLQIKIEKQIDAHYQNDENSKHAIAAKLTLYRDGSGEDASLQAQADNFYAKVVGKDKKGALSIAENIWAEDQVSSFADVLQNSSRVSAGGEVLRPQFSGPGLDSFFKLDLKSFIDIYISGSYINRIYYLLEPGFNQFERGGRWLQNEVINLKPDLSILTQFFDIAQLKPGLLDDCIEHFIALENGVNQNIYSNRQYLLDKIEERRFTQKEIVLQGSGGLLGGFEMVERERRTNVNTDFLRLKDILLPPDLLPPREALEERIRRAEKYIDLQGVEKDNVQGHLTYRNLERLRYMLEEAELEALLASTGRESSEELAGIESGILKDRADKYRRDKEAEAALFAFIVEMIVASVILLATGGTAGVILAGLLSKAAGMAVKEAMLDEHYDLFSDENFKVLLTGVLTDLATAGVGSKFEMLKQTQRFKDLTTAQKIMAYTGKNAAEQISSATIDGLVNQRLPNIEEEIIKLVVSTPFEGAKGYLDISVNKSNSPIRKAVVEGLTDMTSQTAMEAAAASVNDRDLNLQGLISGITRPVIMQMRSNIHINPEELPAHLRKRHTDEKRVDSETGIDQPGISSRDLEMATGKGRQDTPSPPVKGEDPQDVVAPKAPKTTPETPTRVKLPSRRPGEEVSDVSRIDPYPEGLAHYGIKSHGEAFASYKRSLESDMTREAGIWYSPSRGEYVVVQGGRDFVSGDWSTSRELAASDWRILEHFHPRQDYSSRFASTADFFALYSAASQAGNQALDTRIRWVDESNQVQYSHLGYDPNASSPFWIKYIDDAGQTQIHHFDDTPWNANSSYIRMLKKQNIDEPPLDFRSENLSTPRLRTIDPEFWGQQLHIESTNATSIEAARQAGIPSEVYASGYVKTLADFPDLVPEGIIPANRDAPPRLNTLGRTVSRSEIQNREVRADLSLIQNSLEGSGAKIVDVRIDQTQVATLGGRSGTNRPDLQFTILHAELNGRRVYIEYDRSPPSRAIYHARRIIANDPSAIVILKVIDFEPVRGLRSASPRSLGDAVDRPFSTSPNALIDEPKLSLSPRSLSPEGTSPARPQASFEVEINRAIDEAIASLDDPHPGSVPFEISFGEVDVVPPSRSFREILGDVDFSKMTAQERKLLEEGYERYSSNPKRKHFPLKNSDEYMRFVYGNRTGQIPKSQRLSGRGLAPEAERAITAGILAERIQSSLRATPKNTAQINVRFQDPVRQIQVEKNVIPDFMPTARKDGSGQFVPAREPSEAILIADSKYTWDANKNIVISDQIRAMIILARRNNVPFVFLLKEGAQGVSSGIHEFARSVGAEIHLVRDNSGLIR